MDRPQRSDSASTTTTSPGSARVRLVAGPPPRAREWRREPPRGPAVSATAATSFSYRVRTPGGGAKRRWHALLAAAALATAAGGEGPASASERPVSSHAMVYSCCMPLELKQRIFSESAALRATYIRVDVEVNGIYGGTSKLPRADWSMLDQTLAVARAHPRLRVLGILLGTPEGMAEPCDRETWRCAPRDPERYAELVGQIVRRARGTIDTWELVNEPCLYTGVSAEKYAGMLAAAYRSIKSANPKARVVIGDPVAGCGSTRWLERVLELAPRSFDVANLHLRGSLRSVQTGLRRWRSVYARYSRGRAPLWVTEFGYPGTSDCQGDPGYRGGELAQARYLSDGLDVLTEAGAAQVFVTLRDNLDGCWMAEGIAGIAGEPPFASRRKPAFASLRGWQPVRRLCARSRRHRVSCRLRTALAGRCRRLGRLTRVRCCHPRSAARRSR